MSGLTYPVPLRWFMGHCEDCGQLASVRAVSREIAGAELEQEGWQALSGTPARLRCPSCQVASKGDDAV